MLLYQRLIISAYFNCLRRVVPMLAVPSRCKLWAPNLRHPAEDMSRFCVFLLCWMTFYSICWLVVWSMSFMTFHILGMSSSQVTFIFFRGVETTNQIQFDDDVSHYFSLVTIKQQYTDNPSIIAPKFDRLKPNFYPIALTYGNFWSYPTFRYKSCKQTCYPIISP